MNKLEDQFGNVERVYSGLLNDVLALRSPEIQNLQTMMNPKKILTPFSNMCACQQR